MKYLVQIFNNMLDGQGPLKEKLFDNEDEIKEFLKEKDFHLYDINRLSLDKGLNTLLKIVKVSKQYLVQVFERSHYGNQLIEEKVVIGEEGIRKFLYQHTFIDKVINEAINNKEYISMCDHIIVLDQNEDGSFDYWN